MSSATSQANDNSANTQQGNASTLSGNRSIFTATGGLTLSGRGSGYVEGGGISINGKGNIFNTSDPAVAAGAISAVSDIAKKSVTGAYDFTGDVLDQGFGFARDAVSSANLFANRATAAQNDVIAASTAQQKAAYDFAASQAQPGNTAGANAIKYILGVVAVLAVVVLFVFRPRRSKETK